MANENLAHYPSAEAFANKLRCAKILTEKVIKQSEHEKTQVVYLALPDGSREGPYVHKIISSDAGLGNVYKLLFDAQNEDSTIDESALQTSRGIPWIYAYKKNNNEINIIEEFINGVDLATFCEDGCTESEAIEIALSLCRAVSYLHESFTPAIIHRDIKPENIIVRCDKPSGNLSRSVCLIDFGIARAYDETAEKDTRAFGTKGYAPPEQFGFAQTDERSDIYSLGKVLEFLFGSVNYNTGTDKSINNDTRADIAENQKRKLSSLSKKITQTACAFDPENRFNSVKEIIDILEDYKNCDSAKHDNEIIEVEASLEDADYAISRKAKNNSNTTSIAWIAYDIILMFVFVLLSICTGSYFFSEYTNTIVDASSKAAGLEPIIGFVIVEILIFLPALILLFYKKPLYKKWPSLPKISLRAGIIMVIVCVGLIMVLMFILQAIAAS